MIWVLPVVALPYHAGDKVTLKEDVETYTTDNGIVQVRTSKATGNLVSFRPFSGVQGAPGPATPYTIQFDMSLVPR
jgi:hypothetical protein